MLDNGSLAITGLVGCRVTLGHPYTGRAAASPLCPHSDVSYGVSMHCLADVSTPLDGTAAF